MTFAGLLLEISRRAAELRKAKKPADVALEIAVAQLLERPVGVEIDPARRILAALLGIGEGADFDASILERLTPEDVLHLDFVVGEIVDSGNEKEVVAAIRARLLRPVH